VCLIRRQLRYRDPLPPQEKGIDVALAVDLVHLAFRRQYDALVVFSGDTDLLPAIELVVSLGLGHVEVACWSGAKPLRFASGNRPWCHFLGADDWKSVIDDWDGRSQTS
jgi:NYN domain